MTWRANWVSCASSIARSLGCQRTLGFDDADDAAMLLPLGFCADDYIARRTRRRIFQDSSAAPHAGSGGARRLARASAQDRRRDRSHGIAPRAAGARDAPWAAPRPIVPAPRLSVDPLRRGARVRRRGA